MKRAVKSPAIDWNQIDKDSFDRLVEALVVRQHQKDRVRVIDGRGGDGGKDIEVEAPDGSLTVFQLKYFPEGFSGPYNKRRSQIKRSLDSILKENLREWVLVSPNRFTPSEWTYIQKLRGELDFKIGIWDRAHLDSMLAKQPDLVSFIQRGDDLARLAEIYNIERAYMSRPAIDLAARARDLGSVIDDVDPNYTLDFQRQGNAVTSTLRTKDGVGRSAPPIRVAFNASLDRDNRTAEMLARHMRFGSREEIHFAPDQIENFRIEGTSLFDGLGDPTAVALVPMTPDQQIPCLLEARDSHGGLIRQFRGSVLHGGAGNDGYSLEIRLYSSILRVFISNQDQGGNADYQLDFGTATPLRDIENTSALTTLLYDAPSFDLRYANGELALQFRPSMERPDWIDEIYAIQEMAEDVMVINHELRLDLGMPEAIYGVDQVLIRIVRHALEGRITLHPNRTSVTFTLDPNAPNEVLAGFFSGQAGGVYYSLEEHDLELAGIKIPSITFSYWHPAMRPTANPEELVELHARYLRGDSVDLELASDDGTPFRIYAIDRLRDSPASLTRWGLHKVQEHEAFDACLRQAEEAQPE